MDLLSGLNAAQREAVTHRGGPLMVLAGPGTGKTRLIVHRVAHMILEEGVPPDQIVALTFTVKACEQMRQRLAEVLSEAAPGEAAKANLVNVHTYHGAGHRLVKRFADRLGLGRSGRDLELIDSAQRRRMLRRLIGEDGHMRAMLGQGVDAAAERAADTIDALGDYAVDPKGALALAKKWAERLKANAEGLDGAVLAMERAEQTIFEQTARLYDACQREQRKRGWLTFGDLIAWPLALLRNDQLARDLIRGQWRHGVVDEFQDVNQATIALLEELFPPKSSPDLCVVGDDDQAIYAFRGADDRAFARFTERWPGHATVKLEENYRSEAAVIAVANATIGRAENRYDPTKVVRRPDARKSAKAAGGAGAVAVLTDRYADSGEPIVAMLMRQREENKGLKWSRVAVVARSHLELDRVSMALEAEGIPADRVGGRGNAAVDDPGVKDLLAWCRVLVEPLDFEHARRLLLRPPVGLSGERVLALLQQFKAARSRVGVEDETNQVGAAGFIPWAAGQCVDEPAVVNLAKIYAEFRARLAGSPAADLLYDLSLRTDVVHADLLPSRERGRRLAAVVSLLRFAFARQKRLDQPGDLAAFLSYWDDLDRREQEGLAESARVDADDEAVEIAGDDDDGGVVLITAHAAKGLEFDTVFVPKVSPALGYPSSRSQEPRLPATVLKELGAHVDEQERRAAEERRLFYVACTRAERRLVLMGSIPKGKSTSTNYLLELTANQPKLEGLEQTDLETVVGGGGWRPAAGSSVAKELLETKVRKDRDAKRDELAARARAQAASALEKAFRAAVTASDLAEAEAALADAAKTLAIVAEAHASGGTPAWVKKDKALAERAGAIAQTLKPDAETPALFDTAGAAVPRVRGPLTLSYTQINEFERCPGCWYVKTQMKLERTPSSEISTGVVVHEALCEFFGRWGEADAQGLMLPGVDELLVLGRARFIEATEGGVLDKYELERCEQMLRTAFALHARSGDQVHIIERPELEVRVPVQTPSGLHTLYACIDRLERLPDADSGGVRIVDYKTGKEWKKLTEPPADDLQMGIYSMAVDHFFGGGEEPPPRTPGVAEYWLLATGAVGSIGLDKLNMKKVRKRIEDAAEGMLSGPYPSGERCSEGLCRLLTPGVVVNP